MNKKITILFGMIFLIGIVVAAGLLPRTDLNIELEEKQIEALDSINLSDFDIGNLTCDGETCRSRLYKKNAINTHVSVNQKYCSLFDGPGIDQKCLEYTNNTYEDLLAFRDMLIEIRLEGIANVTIDRQKKELIKDTILGEGTVTTVEK